MTKKEMILKIQRAEANAWKEYKQTEKEFGVENKMVAFYRGEWSTLYNLRISLGIGEMSISQQFAEDLLPTY
jgi:hypothetical protein